MGLTLDLLRLLAEANVEFVLIGGMAAVIHGSPRITEDTDVCAPLDDANIQRIALALQPYHPRFRFHPKLPPLPTEPTALHGFRTLNLETDLGKIDVLSEVTGVGGYDDVKKHSIVIEVGEMSISVLDVDTLIVSKQAAGRTKDKLAIPELEAIRDHLRRQQNK